MTATLVDLEIGKRWVIASARDWPGWCRRGKGEEGVLEADRAYARKVGVRMPPRTPPADLHEAVLAAVRAVPTGTAWPVRYLVRRSTWHALDHAWEVEDRSPAPA